MAVFLARALSLPASPSSMSAIFSAIPTSAVPTTTSSALFSAIPTTTAVPTAASSNISSSIAVPAADSEDIAELIISDDSNDDDNDDNPPATMDEQPANVSTPQNNSSPYNHKGNGPFPYHPPYQPHPIMNHTAPYLNLTLTSTSNNAVNDEYDNNDDMTPSMNTQIDENTDGDEDDDENNDGDGDDGSVVPIGLVPVMVSSSSSKGVSTAELIPDSRMEA